MKVSVVVTVYNEAGTIKPLLDSLLEQSLAPREIIVVDAGSTDGTVDIIKHYSITFRDRDRGTNRSKARNAGIKAAKNEIIAVTDAGCTADKYWLERLVKPFKDKNVQSVAGFYRPVTKTPFQQAIAPFVAVMPDKFNPKTYLPSSRSLAFRRGAAWYPENLNYCEDLIFAQRLKAAGKMAVVAGAKVSWQMQTTWAGFFWQIFHYTGGDVRARYWPHLIKIATVWLRYVLFLTWPPLFLVYLLWLWLVKKVSLTVQLVADSAVLTGSLSAIISPEI